MSVSPKPTVLLIHGWDDDPSQGWLAWLAQELTSQGYMVIAPHFLAQPKPSLTRWMQQLHAVADKVPAGSIVVGHSLGCWLALRLLESFPLSHRVKALLCVSGFADAPRPEATRHFEPAPDWKHLQQLIQKRICIYSDNDRIVTPERTRALAHHLDAELICLPGRGHFLGSRGMDTLPELLELIELQ